MDLIMTWIDSLADGGAVFLAWIERPEVALAFWPAVLSTLVAALVGWLLISLTRGLGRLPSFLIGFVRLRQANPMEAALVAYRARLAAQTFEIRHAWMKQGQTLGEIMVPVSVAVGGDGGAVENLPVVLSQLFSPTGNAPEDGPSVPLPRIAVIGEPGSGKSVALRMIAREGWDLLQPGPGSMGWGGLVPVLLTFAEFRDSGLDLVKAVVTSLRRRGFDLPQTVDRVDAITAWVRGALAEARLLVLIDALDELDRTDRAQSARVLNQAPHDWPQTAFVVSCRTAAWQDQIEDPRLILMVMAPFHGTAIRQFVRHWQFEPPKSADELLRVMARQTYVSDLARNPLMLTIVCFLYGQPKYRLPDNRAQFYEVCSRALLEEWDQAQSSTRANWFDRPHKEYVLAALAFSHIAGDNPERDIDEDAALSLLAIEMERGGLDCNELILNGFWRNWSKTEACWCDCHPTDYAFRTRLSWSSSPPNTCSLSLT